MFPFSRSLCHILTFSHSHFAATPFPDYSPHFPSVPFRAARRRIHHSHRNHTAERIESVTARSIAPLPHSIGIERIFLIGSSIIVRVHPTSLGHPYAWKNQGVPPGPTVSRCLPAFAQIKTPAVIIISTAVLKCICNHFRRGVSLTPYAPFRAARRRIHHSHTNQSAQRLASAVATFASTANTLHWAWFWPINRPTLS